MPGETKLVNLRVGEIEVRCEWNNSQTAELLYQALPLSASGSYWGGEIYFDVPVRTSSEPDAADVVEPGTVAYWPAGPCLCVFWGPTPASVGEECRTASAVNIVGRVLNPEVLPQLTGRAVRVEAAG